MSTFTSGGTATRSDTTSYRADVYPSQMEQKEKEEPVEIGIDEICSRLSISRTTFFRLRRRNLIPAPIVKRYPPVCVWAEDVVLELVEKLAKTD